tara:strand:- start:3663 stop:3995 length:333 start_codon:yes stop_codon:yes gene_type:complete
MIDTALTISNSLALTEEQYKTIETMAGINYGPREIALLLDLDLNALLSDFQNPNSKVYHHYKKGVLAADFEVDKMFLERVEAGNITAGQEYKKASEKRRFENHKKRILNE